MKLLLTEIQNNKGTVLIKHKVVVGLMVLCSAQVTTAGHVFTNMLDIKTVRLSIKPWVDVTLAGWFVQNKLFGDPIIPKLESLGQPTLSNVQTSLTGNILGTES